MGPKTAAAAYAVAARPSCRLSPALRAYSSACSDASAALPKWLAVPWLNASRRQALRHAGVVSGLLEHRHRRRDRLGRLVQPVLGAGPEAYEQPDERRMCPDVGGPDAPRLLDRLVEHGLGVGEATDLEQRLAVVRQQLEPRVRFVREERDRPLEQVRRRGHVAPRERAPTRRRQPPRPVRAERPSVVVERPELGQVAVRLLQVVAEDLLVLGRALAVDAVRPLDEAARGSLRGRA